jgi:hypothetical protein
VFFRQVVYFRRGRYSVQFKDFEDEMLLKRENLHVIGLPKVSSAFVRRTRPGPPCRAGTSWSGGRPPRPRSVLSHGGWAGEGGPGRGGEAAARGWGRWPLPPSPPVLTGHVSSLAPY